MTQQITKPNPITTLRTMLEQAAPKLQAVAPKHLKVERLTRLMLAAASNTPAILNCTPESVLQFCLTCSATGLEPIGAGGIWPIPFSTKLTAIIDYRGMVNVAKRAGCIKDAWAENVYTEDEFDYELGLNPSLTHKPARGARGKLESSYCVMLFPDDTKRFIVMSADEIDGIRSRSKSGNSGPWKSDPGEMAKKTVIRRAMKSFTGTSKELDAAFVADDAINGLQNVTERAPVPMPIAISEEPLPMEQEAPASESAAPTPEPKQEDAAATPKREEAAAPAGEVTIDPSWLEYLEVEVTEVRNPKNPKAPYMISTKEHGILKAWDKDLVATAEELLKSNNKATVWYIEKASDNPKYPNTEYHIKAIKPD